MDKPYFSDAKVGDKVWSFVYGWGCILSITKFWIQVENELPSGRVFVEYDLNGKFYYSKERSSQVLFWSEIKFEIPPMPKRKVKHTIIAHVDIYRSVGTSDHYFAHNILEFKSTPNIPSNNYITTVPVTIEFETEE